MQPNVCPRNAPNKSLHAMPTAFTVCLQSSVVGAVVMRELGRSALSAALSVSGLAGCPVGRTGCCRTPTARNAARLDRSRPRCMPAALDYVSWFAFLRSSVVTNVARAIRIAWSLIAQSCPLAISPARTRQAATKFLPPGYASSALSVWMKSSRAEPDGAGNEPCASGFRPPAVQSCLTGSSGLCRLYRLMPDLSR